MKFLFTLLSFLSLFSIILANPVPQGQGSASDSQGPQTCEIIVNQARHRICPEVDDKKCPVMGSYAKGTMVHFVCYVVGETVDGNIYWARNSAGRYVSETLIDKECRVKLPKCE